MQIKCVRIVLNAPFRRYLLSKISLRLSTKELFRLPPLCIKHLFGRPRKRRNYEWVGKFSYFPIWPACCHPFSPILQERHSNMQVDHAQYGAGCVSQHRAHKYPRTICHGTMAYSCLDGCRLDASMDSQNKSIEVCG